MCESDRARSDSVERESVPKVLLDLLCLMYLLLDLMRMILEDLMP
jgi:hypothetical protein